MKMCSCTSIMPTRDGREGHGLAARGLPQGWPGGEGCGAVGRQPGKGVTGPCGFWRTQPSSRALNSWGAEHMGPDGNRHSSQTVLSSPKGRQPPSRGQSTSCVPLQMKSHSCWLSGHNVSLRPSVLAGAPPGSRQEAPPACCVRVLQGLQARLPRGSELAGSTSAPRLSSGRGVVGTSHLALVEAACHSKCVTHVVTMMVTPQGWKQTEGSGTSRATLGG